MTLVNKHRVINMFVISCTMDAFKGKTSTGLEYNNGQHFYTKDRDNSYQCSVECHSGWWFNGCTYGNLNGNYETPGSTSTYRHGSGGMIYYNFRQTSSLKETKMMFRQIL